MMRSATNKVSSVLRIVRGERDALVRTAHFKAASENVSFATIERKIMSTKTTFKRVALVAVAGLGLGMLSVAVPTSASAAAMGSQVYQIASKVTALSVALATTTPTVGSAVNVNFGATTVGGETNAAGVAFRYIGLLTTYPAGGFAQTTATNAVGGTFLSGNSILDTTTTAVAVVHTPAAGAAHTADTITATSAKGIGAFTFTPTIAGTYIMTVWNDAVPTASATGGDQLVTPGEFMQTISITVVAASTYSGGFSTSFKTNTIGDVATSDSATSAFLASKTAGTGAGTISVTTKDGNDVALNGMTVTATITGSGLIKCLQTVATTAGDRRSCSLVNTAAGDGADSTNFVNVSADGTAGTGVVTITVTDAAAVTTTLSTDTFTFVGAATNFTQTADVSKTYIGAGETDTIAFTVVDSLGNTAADFTTVATSSNTLVATVANGTSLVTVTGVGAGTAVITVCNTTCTTAGALSKTFTVTVTKITAASFTLTFDKATYAPGEKMTLTVAALDADGKGVADGSRALFSSTGLTSNAALSNMPTVSANVALVGGVKTFTLYAPLISGDVSVYATQGAAINAVIAGGTGAVVTGSASVSGGSADAALDAANEATDAAYAAADAADNATQAAVDAGAAAAMAQESADAALAAVTDLGIKVTGLLDALSKSLANIYKIIKAIQAKQK